MTISSSTTSAPRSSTGKKIILLGVLGSLFFWAFVGYELLSRTEGHVGYNILWAISYFCCFLGFTLSRIFFQKRVDPVSVFSISLCILSIALVLFVYYTNLLVPYEEWIRRGMPNRGSW